MFGLLILGVLIALGVAAATFAYIAPVDAFERGPDERRLILHARVGTGESVLLPLTREGPEEVFVLILARRDTGLREGFVVLSPVTIGLREPLGPRRIVGPGGVPVPERRR